MSKFRIHLLVLSVLLFGFSCRAEEPVKKIRILGVGNSFTVNSTKFLTAIIKSDKEVDADVGVAYIGGCPMDKHVTLAKIHEENPEDPKGMAYRYIMNRETKKEKASLKEMLLDGKWDYITIQQVSTKSYKPETYYPYAKELCDYIKKYAPDAKIVIHETWAHRVDCPRVKQWNLPPAEMYAKLHAAYGKIGKELGLDIIPVGTAFENAKKLPLWDYVAPENFDPKKLVYPEPLPDQSKSLHNGYYWGTDKKDKTKKFVGMDGFHAGVPGEYLGGLVWYEFFFNKDARNITYAPDELKGEKAESLRKVAHETMETARAEKADKTEAPKE
ncbi:MAG: DUF4886 domain-containing protein [Planctomycetes bacterium]|nr:DUF4886 domain-containing protein [Planctomycetota bacterium]